jgi:hypothetical protein
MPIDDTPLESQKRNNLGFILSVVVSLALLMVAATTTVFLRSGAYTTVKQIQIGSRLTDTFDNHGLDVTSPIKSTDIDVLSDSVLARVRSLDDATDFDGADVSDTALGLNR